jgi:hypothetical protein
VDGFGLVDGFRSSGWLWHWAGFILVYRIGLVDVFVLLYSIGQVDCWIVLALWMVLGLVDGFGIGDRSIV